LKVVHGKIAGRPPRLDLDAEKRLHALLAEGAARGILRSAHDASEGGLAVTLAECAFRGEEPGLGGRFDLSGGLRPDVLLFSETPSRAVVTTRDELRTAELARRHGARWRSSVISREISSSRERPMGRSKLGSAVHDRSSHASADRRIALTSKALHRLDVPRSRRPCRSKAR